MAHLGAIMYENIEAWLMDSGFSHDVIGLILVFSNFIEIDFDYYVGCGTNTKIAMR